MLFQSQMLVDAAVEAGVKHIVHLGVFTSRHDSIPLFVWHDLIETYIKASGIAWTNIHPMLIQILLICQQSASITMKLEHADEMKAQTVVHDDVLTVLGRPGAFQSARGSLQDIQIFHTDRSNEFKNKTIDDTLLAFNIQRSLSHKGCPYDNAVAEATYKKIKTEFVRNQIFFHLYHLKIELADYVHWFNNHRIHSSLGYLTPARYRINTFKKTV